MACLIFKIGVSMTGKSYSRISRFYSALMLEIIPDGIDISRVACVRGALWFRLGLVLWGWSLKGQLGLFQKLHMAILSSAFSCSLYCCLLPMRTILNSTSYT